jgi:hypothetical protein
VPRALAQETVWDAGRVSRGTKVAHEFVIRNEGTETIFIREVRPSCGCTVASFDPSIAPGGTARVRAEVDTAAFRGPIAKEVTVFTSDPGNPQLALTVRVDVEPPVDALPGYFRFRHVQGEPAESFAQTIFSADRPDFAVTGARSPLPYVHLAVRPAALDERQARASGPQFVVVATLRDEAPVGPLDGDITVTTNDPRQPTLTIPLAGDVRASVTLVPPVVDFGSFTGGEARRGSLIVNNNAKAPLEVLGVDTDVRGLQATLQPRQAGKSWTVQLTVAADAPKGPLAGTVRVRTSSPRQPLIEARIVGTVN